MVPRRRLHVTQPGSRGLTSRSSRRTTSSRSGRTRRHSTRRCTSPRSRTSRCHSSHSSPRPHTRPRFLSSPPRGGASRRGPRTARPVKEQSSWNHLLERVWNERNRDRPTPIQFRHTPRRIRTGRRGTSGASTRNASRSPWPASWASHGVGAGLRRSIAGPCGEARGASSRGSHWQRHGAGWSSVACAPQDAVATQAGQFSGARSATSARHAPQASARVEKGVAQASHRVTATACIATKATQESSRAVVAPVRARMPCMGAFTYGRRFLMSVSSNPTQADVGWTKKILIGGDAAAPGGMS